MLNGLKNLVNRSSHEDVAKPTDGNRTNGHGSNGRRANGTSVKANGSHRLDETWPTAIPQTSIRIPEDYRWTLEVRQDQHILGSMHSINPFVLISFFRDYSLLYGEPVESYAVWLRHKDSNRGAPMHYQPKRSAWIEFLLKLDPDIEDTLAALNGSKDRTSMLDPEGRPTHPDAVLEKAFGLVRKSA